MSLGPHRSTLFVGLILALGARNGHAQTLTLSGSTLTPIYSTTPSYVDLVVDDVLGIQGTTTDYSADILSGGRLFTIHVSTKSSFFYTPISSASAQIFHRTLNLTKVRSAGYDVTLEKVWVYPRFSTVDYYATSRTILKFSPKSIASFPWVDSLVWGKFGDPMGEFFGTFALWDPSSGGRSAPRTYALLKVAISGDCNTVNPMRLSASSCGNLGVLDLLDDMIPYGAIAILDYCKDGTRIDGFGSRTRIVHCNSGWWN